MPFIVFLVTRIFLVVGDQLQLRILFEVGKLMFMIRLREPQRTKLSVEFKRIVREYISC